ncbi:DUF3379 family protein [Ferrimonas gelatinilytica]|uniref:DUF3379 domain-containing protein n=1 Tax=Ferrimonas gelatinilytica TaxID=1255257 RepID=A0ABP9S6T7_9GAMM
MDDLEFRRRLYADPNRQDEELRQIAEGDPAQNAFWQELRALDQQLACAIKVPVPADLAERLLLQQQLKVHRSARRQRWQLGLVASVALLALGLFLVSGQRSADLGEHALAHMAHEQDFVAHIDEQITLDALNTKLAALGGTLSDIPGEIYYANYCHFEGVRSLHVVMGSDQGRVTLFVIPSQSQLTLPHQFANDSYLGLGLDKGPLHLALVGTREQQLQPLVERLRSDLKLL